MHRAVGCHWDCPSIYNCTIEPYNKENTIRKNLRNIYTIVQSKVFYKSDICKCIYEKCNSNSNSNRPLVIVIDY